MDHVGGMLDRIFAQLSGEETSLPAAGQVKTVTVTPQWGEPEAKRELRSEAKSIIASGRPEANQFQDIYGTKRFAVIPQAGRRVNPVETLISRLMCFNIKPVNRTDYENALLPPPPPRRAR